MNPVISYEVTGFFIGLILSLTAQYARQKCIDLFHHFCGQLICLTDALHQIGLDKGWQQFENLTGLFSRQAGQGYGDGLGVLVQQRFCNSAVVHINLAYDFNSI